MARRALMLAVLWLAACGPSVPSRSGPSSDTAAAADVSFGDWTTGPAVGDGGTADLADAALDTASADGPSPDADDGPDAGPDTAPDTVPDTGSDSGPDTVPDSGPDTVPDAVADSGSDSGPQGDGADSDEDTATNIAADSTAGSPADAQPADVVDAGGAPVDVGADNGGSAADTCTGTACGGNCCPPGSLCVGGSCVDCTSLTPTANAAADTSRIEACLAQTGSAVLAAGTFTVSHGLTLPVGATLKAQQPKQATLLLAAGNPDNHLLTVKDNGRVSGLVLDAMDKLASGNEAVVHITGSQALVDGNEIRSTKAQGAKHRGAGIYFIGASGKDSKAEDNDIHDLFYGVIFAWMLDAAHPNTAQGNKIRDNACDSVTFAGFGRAVGNTIFHNGWDCQNGPIPGGGIYCLDNAKGAQILDNTIYDNCGMGIDIDSCQGLVITGNKVWNPGYRWDGWAPWCNAFGAITVVDSSGFTISGNVAENNDRPGNSFVGLKDVNGLFSASGKAAFSDLPSGANQVIAFVLARRKGAAAPKTTGSTISGNQFRAACKAGLGCVGLGWFVSRNTGYDGGAWQPNFFTSNDPFGSQIGSKRCGGNWYAGDSVCNAGSSAPCNGDDHQHNPPQGDAYRNDKCNAY